MYFVTGVTAQVMVTVAKLQSLLTQYCKSEEETDRLNLLRSLVSAGAGKKCSALRERYGGRTALFVATSREDVEMLECMLLAIKGVPLHNLVMMKCGEGWTAVHFAAMIGHNEIIEMMTKHQDQSQLKDVVNSKDNRGYTAIDYAKSHGHTWIVEYLSQL